MTRRFPGESEPEDQSWRDVDLDYSAEQFAKKIFDKVFPEQDIAAASEEIREITASQEAETFATNLAVLYWIQEGQNQRRFSEYVRSLNIGINQLQSAPILTGNDEKTRRAELQIALYYSSPVMIPEAELYLRYEKGKGKIYRHNYFFPGVNLTELAELYKEQIIARPKEQALISRYIELVKDQTDEYSYPYIAEVEKRIDKILEHR